MNHTEIPMTKTNMGLTELLQKHDQGDLLRPIAGAVLQLKPAFRCACQIRPVWADLTIQPPPIAWTLQSPLSAHRGQSTVAQRTPAVRRVVSIDTDGPIRTFMHRVENGRFEPEVADAAPRSNGCFGDGAENQRLLTPPG